MKMRRLAGKVLTGLVVGIGAVAMLIILLWQMIVMEGDVGSGSFGWIMVGLSLVLGILWASVIVHESGHLLAALAVRLRVYHVDLGPVKFVRDGGRIRLRLDWRYTTHGYVIAMPTETHALRRRMLLYISGGPLANLLVGSLLSWVGLHGSELALDAPRPGYVAPARAPWLPNSPLIGWLDFAAVMNLTLFARSLIPGTSGGFTTDGGQLLALLRGDHFTERQLLIFGVGAISNGGVRPRDWDAFLLERILAASDGSAYDVAANLYGYYCALDCGRVEEAGQRLDQAVGLLQVVVPERRSSIHLESAYFLAFHRQDAVAARSALDLATGGIEEKPTRLRAEASVLLAEGDYDEAARKAEEGLKELPQLIDRGGAIAEGEWITAICDECQKRMGQTKAAGPIPSH